MKLPAISRLSLAGSALLFGQLFLLDGELTILNYALAAVISIGLFTLRSASAAGRAVKESFLGTTLGGLGMVVGAWLPIGAQPTAGACSCCSHGSDCSLLLMALGCASSCFLCKRAPVFTLERLLRIGVCLIAMFLGMDAGMALLAPVSTGILGIDAGAHWAMLVGMFAGGLLGSILIHRIGIPRWRTKFLTTSPS